MGEAYVATKGAKRIFILGELSTSDRSQKGVQNADDERSRRGAGTLAPKG